MVGEKIRRFKEFHDGTVRIPTYRVRSFKRSRDPAFAAKLTDIVGHYVDPPSHAVVLSIDEEVRSRCSIALSQGCH